MRVLFVSGIDGFCHRYQVLHRAAQLLALGATASVRHFTDPRLLDDVVEHDLLFAYRVPETSLVHALLARAGDLGVPRLAAIDDLIFVDNPDFLPALDALPEDERERWRAGVRRYRATIEGCDAFVAPTEPLVEVADRLGLRAYLHRNSVAPAELELGRRARRDVTGDADQDVVLGYFSGTPTHDEDFASIARALRDVLRAHAGVRLLLVGPVQLPPELEPFAARIERRGLVSWEQLPSLVARTAINLAPLSTERRFATAKGEIKYLEAAAVAVPTVASAVSAYRHAICDGDNGRLATTQDEWRRALDDLIRDRDVRARLGVAALADVATRYSEQARARELLAILSDVRGGLRRRAQSPSSSDASPPPFDVEPPARVALEPDACPAFPVAAPDAVSPPLAAGRRLVQRVRVVRDGLERIDLHVVTYGQPQSYVLGLALRRDDGTLAAEAEIPAAAAPDRAWLALDLPAPETRSAGRVYALELRARAAGASSPSALCFGTTTEFALADDEVAAGALGPVDLDGAPLAAALVVRGFADWRRALDDEPSGRSGACDAGRSAASRTRPGDDVRSAPDDLRAGTWRA